jgi:hypothetical protein
MGFSPALRRRPPRGKLIRQAEHRERSDRRRPRMPERRAPLPAAAAPGRSAVADFVLARWRGEIPLGRALWWDMWCVGTTVNLATALVALLLIARDLPDALGAALYFSPLPYNALLLVSVWRSAAKEAGPAALTAQLLSAGWFLVAALL